VVLSERRAQPLEAGLASELRIEFGVIDDVIAMGRALARLHEGRRIEMRNAERLEIGDDSGGVAEIEIRRELHAVGCNRNGGRHQRAPMNQNAPHGGMTSPASPPQIRVPPVSL